MSSRVLVVDDERGVCELLEAGLQRKGFQVVWRTSGQEALELLRSESFDVVVTDLTMPGMPGLELCGHVVENQPDIPVVVITAFGSLDTATAAIRAGAYDFIAKPFELPVLKLTLDRAVRHRALREELKRLRRAVERGSGDSEILGESGAMVEVFDVLDRVADVDTSVVLSGENGTGKELVARTLHRRSRRAGGPFVTVSCAGLPEALLERELFGDVRTMATDAGVERTSPFLRATGGTLFLEDVTDLPGPAQSKLLRVLERRVVCPVGSEKELPCDVRIIAATSRDLETAVEERRFREDLYYAINVVRIALPPLRSRGTDVLLIAQTLVKQFAASKGRPVAGISAPAADKLMAYSWPGNVRELSSCIERAVALARYDQITVDDLPEKIRNFRRSHVIVASDDPAELVSMEEIERRYVTRVLEAAGGNKTRAAQILGFDRATLYRKLDRFALRAEVEETRDRHSN